MAWLFRVRRLFQYAGNLIVSDTNPNSGVPLDASVPVILETDQDDSTTRPWPILFSGPSPSPSPTALQAIRSSSQYAGNLLPDINPSSGLPLDAYVPPIPEDELTTRPQGISTCRAETDNQFRSDRLPAPLDLPHRIWYSYIRPPPYQDVRTIWPLLNDRATPFPCDREETGLPGQQAYSHSHFPPEAEGVNSLPCCVKPFHSQRPSS